ncbi:NAD(P)-dependent alcohol dehydrogenase [Pseudomonas sp. NFX15]|uniref:NAD(P)-dependent alcohol dehydrogenase n=1 Tax=Pseudomonas sp. NFX15 TaxID=2816958 RepID=UPI003B8AB835
MLIKAAVHREVGQPFGFETLKLDAPRDHEVLVKIVATGVCHTDVITRDGHVPITKLPCVLGHEGAGIVLQVGQSVTNVVAGDHVVLSFASCGQCDRCLDQKPSYCRKFFTQNFSGTREDGSSTLYSPQTHENVCGCFFGQSSFADHAIVDQRNLIKVDKDIPLELLGPLGCGFQTGAGAVLNFLKPAVGSSLVIFGVGAVGAAALMAARIAGCAMIIAVDIHDNRLDLALELGAHHVINALRESPVERIKALTEGQGAEYAVEASGVGQVMANALQSVRLAGSVALLGAAPRGSKVELDMNTLGGGRTIKSCVEGDCVPAVFIPQLITYYREGLFPLEKLIRFYEFDAINKAVADSCKGEVIKAVVRMS